MSSSREQSPDWLRSFQAPTHSVPTVSSDLEPLLSDGLSDDDKVDSDKLPIGEFLQLANRHTSQDIAVDEGVVESSKTISNAKSLKKSRGKGDTPNKKNSKIRKRKEVEKTIGKATLEESADKQARDYSVYAISSDSESCPGDDVKNEESTYQGETSDCKASQSQETVKREDVTEVSPPKKTYRRKILKQDAKVEDIEQKTDILEIEATGDPEGIVQEEMEKPEKSLVSSSRLPLVLSEKVQRTKALVECEGDSIDLSGDMGAVGRVVISETPLGDHEMSLDLKGTIYKATINPCRTFCVVSFGQTEAKIEAIMSDYIKLNPQSDFNDAETVVEGTLEGFSLDLDDEDDEMPKPIPHQSGENDGTGEKTKGKTKRKADKASGGLPQKRSRKTGSKREAPAKVSKRTRASKKSVKK